MNKIIYFFICFTIAFNLFSIDLNIIDVLNHKGQHTQAHDSLQKAFDINDPDPQILWRMSRELFEVAELIPQTKRSEKIEAYTKAMDIVEPYLNITYGNKNDQAKIIFFYAANFGSRGRAIGIIESLGNLSRLKELTDRALQLDPSLSLAYLLKAKIEEEVPSLFGGDKFKMGLFYSDALKYDPNNLTFIHDAADALYKRNWKASNKEVLAKKQGINGYESIKLDDRELVKSILDNGVKVFNSLTDPSARDIEQFDKIKNLLTKYN
ncbi:MAG: hypothetical protein A2015_09680 [Spirochaetes bacterium GWF1_31_7]|nr:MAG: hypothetical protein A2Y30_04495 [Spirochaetes bacterium GWE1_32_154]OHD47556.1 MAG: hypothetical protein A2015_09680 [Spirochaetes bacterium GWF1_31_7]OHD52046.1 MAG: hypothetical protein A2Y29_17440 [Spirochaetes bacterium GWE2_31_10]HBD93465.1 hypothetical protein [Spirochaetia bacterium]HBI36227.1 hypothetical protein [Spirochaetia bacterium]